MGTTTIYLLESRSNLSFFFPFSSPSQSVTGFKEEGGKNNGKCATEVERCSQILGHWFKRRTRELPLPWYDTFSVLYWSTGSKVRTLPVKLSAVSFYLPVSLDVTASKLVLENSFNRLFYDYFLKIISRLSLSFYVNDIGVFSSLCVLL